MTGRNKMRTYLYLDNIKKSKKEVEAIYGTERVKRLVADAKIMYAQDSGTELAYFMGRQVLRIEFKL